MRDMGSAVKMLNWFSYMLLPLGRDAPVFHTYIHRYLKK